MLRCKHGHGIDVYGLDYSRSLVEVAKARVDSRPARFMVADVRDVSFLSDENFDAAVVSTLYHPALLLRPAYFLPFALAVILRVLLPEFIGRCEVYIPSAALCSSCI